MPKKCPPLAEMRKVMTKQQFVDHCVFCPKCGRAAAQLLFEKLVAEMLTAGPTVSLRDESLNMPPHNVR